jgi:hypothetical protein
MRLAKLSLIILTAAPIVFAGYIVLNLGLANSAPAGSGLVAYGWPILGLWSFVSVIFLCFVASGEPLLIGIVGGVCLAVVTWFLAAGYVSEAISYLTFERSFIDDSAGTAIAFLALPLLLVMVSADCTRWLIHQKRKAT